MKPIYCIEEYEYFNPSGPSHAATNDKIHFLVLLSCREGTVQLNYSMSELIKTYKEHEPRLHQYLQNLLADIEEFYNSPTLLIRALEREEFDISRLLYAFLDHEDMEHLANWAKKHGKNQRRRTVQEIQKAYTSDEALLDYGAFLSLRVRLTRQVYEALKELALGYLPTFNLLETKLVRSFNKCMNNYAMMMVDMAVSKWEKLDIQEYHEREPDDDSQLSTLAGSRQFYLNYRKNSPVEGCDDSPIFCVEIMDFLEEWESRGWNRVEVWYKLTCAEGEMYDEIDFEYLIQEALLYFPDIHADAMKAFHASNSPRPRHPAMLHGIQRMGHDLTPVLASYVASSVNFLPRLKEEMRLRRRSPDSNQFSYEEKRKWEDELRNPVYTEEFRIVNFLRDGLVTEGMAVILRALPEFHIRVPKSYLHYMEDWLFSTYIDPTNDLHHELEMAFELKRGYKRKYD